MVSPLSTPLKTEYKPLGLEMFAQPLSDMQAKYDTAKVAIEDSAYEINRLSQDSERGAELIKELDEKTSKLAQELMATGNYRQAAEQLKKLNKSFTQDAETKALIGNYDAYKKAVEEQKKRLEKGEIYQTDFDTWDFKTRNQFKGTSYDPATGSYTSINTRPPEENREKEMEEWVMKLANATAEQGDQMIENLGIQGVNLAEIKRGRTWKDRDQMQKELYNMLATSDRFRDYIEDKGQRDFYYANETAKMRGKGKDFQDGLVNNVVSNLDNNIKRLEEAKKKDTDPNNKKEYDTILTNLNTQKENVIVGYNQAQQLGTTDDFTEKLFMEDKRKHFDRISLAAADIKDFNKSTVDVEYREDPNLKKKRDDTVKKFEEVGEIITNVTSGNPNFMVKTGGSTFTQDENKNAQVLVKTNGDILKAIWDTEKEIVPENMDKRVGNQNLTQSKKNLATAAVLTDFKKGYEENISKRANEIADLENKLASASNQAQRDMFKNDINILYEQQAESRIAYSAQELEIKNAVEAELAKTNDPEVKKLYQQYQKDPIGFLNALNTTDKEIVQKTNTFYEELEKRNRQQAEAIVNAEEAELRLSNPNQPNLALLSFDKNARINEEIKKLKEQEGSNKGLAVAAVYNQSEQSKLLSKITNTYRNNIGFQNGGYMVTPTDVVINKSSIAFSNKDLEAANKHVLQNSTGKDPAKKVEVFNPLTGETTIEQNFRSYDITGYKTEEPHWVGMDQDGNIILRYTIKDNLAGDKSKVTSAVANHIRTGKPGQQDPDKLPDNQMDVSPDEITKWKEDNPDDLYIRVKGTSINIENNIKKSYEELVTGAELVGGDEGKEMMLTTLNNFAPM
jgi:hypothetical protein